MGNACKSIHYLNPDTSVNPDDHPDHILTGKVVQSMKMINELDQQSVVLHHSILLLVYKNENYHLNF